MKIITLLIVLLCSGARAGETTIPSYYRIDDRLGQKLVQIVQELGLQGDFDTGEDGIERISLAVIDLNSRRPRLAGVNMDNFIYPASVYKMYVAAAVLEKISRGGLTLTDTYVIAFPNCVDTVREIRWDPRPVLQPGDTVTVHYLLDLMITRSDNTAANCLIDLAQRESINAMMQAYGWRGSEVTRKFLSRKHEDPEYKTIRGTETCALHAADFLYKIYTRQLVNPWVSQQMLTLLGRQLDKSKLASGLPADAMFYHKTGWYAAWTHDVGIVDTGRVRYVVACFLPLPAQEALPKYSALSRKIFQLMNASGQ
ncbi:serine hydrolase [bacterium]|nr:serine hydrolase [bacterium]